VVVGEAPATFNRRTKMRHGSKKDQRGYRARAWSCKVANRVVRRATRAALRILDVVALDDLPFPAPVGGWWDTFAVTTGTRIPRVHADVLSSAFLDSYYPGEVDYFDDYAYGIDRRAGAGWAFDGGEPEGDDDYCDWEANYYDHEVASFAD
jgi:hypothetical protein